MSSFTSTMYFSFPDRATALSVFESVGGLLDPSGNPYPGNQNYTIVEIVEGDSRAVFNADGSVKTPAVVWTGSWWMGRVNTEWEGYAAAMAALSQYDQTARATAGGRTPWNVYF